MYFDHLSSQSSLPPSAKEFGLIGLAIGFISSLVSIGGGSLIVPYLKSRAIDLRVAIGTSSALGFCIAVAGSLGYLIQGVYRTSKTGYWGFIDIYAALLIASASFITAPVGVRLAYRLPTVLLRKLFAVLLLCLSFKMLWLVIFN